MEEKNLKPGARHYKAWIGPINYYSYKSALQFVLLVHLGLKDHHYLLDIGCGSLRAGKLFIPYLLPDRYYGIEPEEWLLKEGIENELGSDIIRIKNPQFLHNSTFDFSGFNRNRFDYVLAQSIFTHATRSQIRTCLQSVSKVLTNNGIFVFNIYEGNRDDDPDAWVYPACCTYTASLIQGFVEDAGLQVQRIRDKIFTGDWFLAALPSCNIQKYSNFFVDN